MDLWNWIEESVDSRRSEKKTEIERKRLRREEEGNWVRQKSEEVAQRGGLDCRNIIDNPFPPLLPPLGSTPGSDQQLHLSKLWSIPAEWTWPQMEIDWTLSPPSLSHVLFFLSFADGDRWCGAHGLSPCRLIIDQEDRDGSRGEEDKEERREWCGGEAEKWEDFKEFMFQEWG